MTKKFLRKTLSIFVVVIMSCFFLAGCDDDPGGYKHNHNYDHSYDYDNYYNYDYDYDYDDYYDYYDDDYSDRYYDMYHDINDIYKLDI